MEKGSRSKDIINCKFVFQCPLSWESLEDTNNPNIRFCLHCNQNVYFAHTLGELAELASGGKCVAFNQNHDKEQKSVPRKLMGMAAPEFDQIYVEQKKAWWHFWK